MTQAKRIDMGDGMFVQNFAGPVLVTTELLLDTRDHCTLEQCGLQMDKADPSKAVIAAKPGFDRFIALRFCRESHLNHWRYFAFPREVMEAGIEPGEWLFHGMKVYHLGEVMNGAQEFS